MKFDEVVNIKMQSPWMRMHGRLDIRSVYAFYGREFSVYGAAAIRGTIGALHFCR